MYHENIRVVFADVFYLALIKCVKFVNSSVARIFVALKLQLRISHLALFHDLLVALIKYQLAENYPAHYGSAFKFFHSKNPHLSDLNFYI